MGKAMRVNRLGEMALEEVRLADPQAGEVRVRVRAAGVNFPDVLMLKGLYQHKPPLPFTLGLEGAGEIVSCGEEVEGFAAGQSVVFRGPSFAEEINVPAAECRARPKGLSWAEAAVYSVAYLTAFVALDRRGALKAGETLLVHGAAGGVGLAAVEMGKIMGACVIATGSSAEKRDLAAKRGADHVLPSQGFRESVKALTEGRGADVIYDPVGGDAFDESVRCIAWGGRLLSVGFASGRIPVLPANMALIKGFSLVGVRAGEHGRRWPQDGEAVRSHIDSLASAGKIRPFIGGSFPLERAAEALALLEKRRALGRIVIEI